MSSAREKLIEDLKALLSEDVTAVKDQVEHIKTQFYRELHQEQEALEQAAQEAGEAYQQKTDELEEQLKELLAQYKARRAEAAAQQAAEQADNLARKQAILEEMKTLAEAETADVMGSLQRMRELQAEWKSIGAVPAEKVQEVRKQYQQYQEQFYDLVRINIELRDLDFKKNLELKTRLCEAAEKLMQNENIVEASRALQQLHDEWAEIGPVARELREDLWNRFKTASTAINKKHQAYFDELHAKEQDNLARKQALIEQMKAIVEAQKAKEESGELNSKYWDEASEQVQAMQNEWRTIGFAPKKYNQPIYNEFRGLCDAFYHAKTAYYKGVRTQLNDNLSHKRDLVARVQAVVEQVKAAPESAEWQQMAESVRAMQAEWKTAGVVARKYSDDLWKQFSEACDEFFNAKREAVKGESRKSKGASEHSGTNRNAKVKAAANQGIDGLLRLRDRLQQEIKTAENNILFFTAKSKTANKLLDGMQQKINALKEQLDKIQEQINNSEDE